MKLRTLIVDDELLSRNKIRGFLQDHPEFQIVGECADGEHAVAAIASHRPDLIFLDVQIPAKKYFSGIRYFNGIAVISDLTCNPYVMNRIDRSLHIPLFVGNL